MACDPLRSYSEYSPVLAVFYVIKARLGAIRVRSGCRLNFPELIIAKCHPVVIPGEGGQ